MTRKRLKPKRKRGRPRKIKQELVTKAVPLAKKENLDIREYVQEASEVRQLTAMAGWGIMERDVKHYRNSLIDKLAYIEPSRPEYYEAKVLFLAADKLLALVNDYENNRDKAIELLNKLDNPELEVTLDVDNELGGYGA